MRSIISSAEVQKEASSARKVVEGAAAVLRGGGAAARFREEEGEQRKWSSSSRDEGGSSSNWRRAGDQTPRLVGRASDGGEGVALMDGAAARGGDGVDGWWCMEVLVDGGRGEGGGAVERRRAPRRPGCSGSRWWRRWGEGDGDARPDGEWRRARDFDPP